MGTALVGGIIQAGICGPENVLAFDAYPDASLAMSKELGVNIADSNAQVVEQSDVILLCVKPQGFIDMLHEIGDSSGRLLISIAAGIRISAIETACEDRHRVIRVMPNTPALVGKGASAFALGGSATPDDAQVAETLLGAVGYVCQVQEDDLDAVTALSGSGPAYIFLMIEAMVAAGVKQGLSPEIAHHLAVQTVAGAAELVIQTGYAPARLRENVTSPNGTTYAALQSFRANKFEQIVGEAIDAAAERSRELGKDE